MDDAVAAQNLLAGLADDQASLARDQFAALWRQCHDAEQGHDGGVDFFRVPF
jgi:hypothetical protein